MNTAQSGKSIRLAPHGPLPSFHPRSLVLQPQSSSNRRHSTSSQGSSDYRSYTSHHRSYSCYFCYPRYRCRLNEECKPRLTACSGQYTRKPRARCRIAQCSIMQDRRIFKTHVYKQLVSLEPFRTSFPFTVHIIVMSSSKR